MKIRFSSYAWIFVLLSMFLAQGCANAGAYKDKNKTANATRIIATAKRVTKSYRLTKHAPACLLFDLADNKFKGMPLVVVRERHGGKCGGDPDTSPRVFSIAIDEATGVIWTDARSLLGQMEKISK